MKYGSETDHFHMKYKIFLTCATQAGLPQQALTLAFPTMLKELARDYYFTTLQNFVPKLEIAELALAVQNHFEDTNYRRRVYLQWNTTSLVTIKAENSGKSTKLQAWPQQQLMHEQPCNKAKLAE